MNEQHDLGECAVFGLRKLTRFFENADAPEASNGFRNPDIITYSVRRFLDGVSLQVNYEERNRNSEVRLINPEVLIDRRFLDLYDGD